MNASENVEGADDPQPQPPNKMQLKKLEQIQNSRYMNQDIYRLFVTGRYDECLQLIQRSRPDQLKLYMKSLIFKNTFKLDKSLQLLMECEVMNKLNYAYLKAIAKNFYLVGKYKSSLQAAKEAFNINTGDHEISYIMAKIALAMKDEQSAFVYLNRSLTKEPNEESFIMLAKLLINKGSLQQAAQQLKKALIISPENDEIYELLAEVYTSLNNPEDSLKFYEEAIERNPTRYTAIFAAAALKQMQGQNDTSFQQYAGAYAISQNSALYWNNLGVLMSKKGREIVAYACFKKALFLDPFRWDLHANLGMCLMRVKKYVGAQMHFQSAIKLKRVPSVFNLLGVCLGELGEYTNARKCFEEALKETNESAYLLNYMCVLLKMGDKQKCRELIKQVDAYKLNQEMKEKLEQIKSMV